ncbi:tRNA (adenosine(37)-N6)-threonylcarbamoyltransferase complex ATPase subunit type 1 TsaE [Pedobacter sp. MC2016-24]|uniref:tRNA (adenosine(37)-N6)-threonylcarbamoyltransferase complex ATPase subunit type 1 TsaE n=1 Tax=Pedobacter sp. MC2016-24 TaxID=2780090 RepID=UPI001880B5E2|nr:tRNA (adenosine(37)-N6)-threonylcarbamoyltransferase complex ATPase subunit type 1 TsaE [Pedobacter sp. MC2016-24]MBE9600657.1 tRNA (adenosine(37)-N6)-threonylcarbamoyltransferase complex ATPase subunit type 1 TsaE [Pedobacter sp. MC2016-24]
MEIEVNGVADLDRAAKEIVDFTQKDLFFIFEGDMGAGKTTLIKSICKELGVKEVVSSPTFSIVNEYAAGDRTVYHFDFYRIKNLQEAYDIGYEEYFYSDHICLIEWPEKIAELLPDHYVKIAITALDENTRRLSISKI